MVLDDKTYFEMLSKKWAKFWPHPSLPREPIYPFGKRPLFEYLRIYAERNPQKDYIIYYGRRISYREMEELTNKFANFLISHGFRKGDNLAMLLPNCPQYHIAFFGTHKAGGCAVSLSPILKEAEMEFFFREVRPKVIVTLDLLAPTVEEVVSHLSIDSVIVPASFREFLPEKPEIDVHPLMQTPTGIENTMTELIRDQPKDKPNVNVSLEDHAVIFFTSGTTGLPKPAVHKHKNALYKAACLYTYSSAHLLVENYAEKTVNFEELARRIAEDEVSLAVMPIFWVAGHDMGVLAPTISGSTVVLLSRWDPVAVLQAIDRYRVTSTYMVFDMYWSILNYPEVTKYRLRSLRTCTGSSFIKGLTKELRDKWKELTGTTLREASYGLTESHTFDTITAGFQTDDLDIKRMEKYGGIFCGIPLPQTFIKIIDEDGKIMPLGQPGEIAIKSPSVIEGYLGNPEANAKSFRDGWLLTGDIGMFDEDGFLYFITRKKYMLKVSGVLVSPSFVEYLILKHPAVESIGVIGAKDPQKGEVPIAFVKLKEEFKGKITEKELLDWCKNNMSPHSVPREIIIKESLPLTPTGKVVKEELIKEYEIKIRS
ncbi:MAG: AMP-binding protein [Archaeoglobaceae archaeon]